jgi:transcriptional regulator, lacI family
MRTTLKDVAREAGVSVTLISKFLNNNPSGRMSPATREKIEETLRRLNYRPSELARSLKRGRSGTLGLVISNLGNPHFGMFADMILREAKKAGYQLLISLCDFGREEELECLNSLLNRQVDGILYAEHLFDSPLIDRLGAEGFPLVADTFSGSFSCTVFQMRNAYEDALNFLADNGARRIVLSYNLYEHADESLRKFRRGVTVEPISVMSDLEERKELFRRICRKAPDAVILPGGLSTLVFFKILEKEFPAYSPMLISCTNAGHQIPRVPGLLGFIRRDYRKKAEAMVRLVCDRINGKTTERVEIPAEFITINQTGEEDELF